MLFGNVPKETSDSSVKRLCCIVPVFTHTSKQKYKYLQPNYFSEHKEGSKEDYLPGNSVTSQRLKFLSYS